MKISTAFLICALATVSLTGCGSDPEASHAVVTAPNATWPNKEEVVVVQTVRKEERPLSKEERGIFNNWFKRTVELFCKLDFINRKDDDACLNDGK